MARETKLSERSSETSFAVRVDRDQETIRVRSDEPAFDASVELRDPAVPGVWSVVTARGSYEARVRVEDGGIQVEIDGERFSFGDAYEGDAAGASRRSTARSEVKAPMPGKVVKLLVSEGEPVESGQGVLLFEAMKMQNEIRSPQAGILAELAVEEGQPVDARERLFVVRQI